MKFIYGEEQYLINKKIKEYIKVSNVEALVFDAEASFDDIEIDLTTIGLFSDEKLVVIKNHPMFSKKDLGTNMVEILKSLGSETELIFVFETKKRLEKTNPLIAYLLKEAECSQHSALKESEVISIIKDIVSSKNGKISNGAAIKLSIKLPNNLYIIIREVEKLLLENKEITNDMVDESIGDYVKEDAFALSNAIINGDSHEIISAYKEKISNGEIPSRVIGNITIVLSLAKLISAHQQQGKTNSEIAEVLHIHPFRVKKSAELIANTSVERLNILIEELAKLDKDIKIGKVDPRLGLDRFVLDLIRDN